VTRDITAAVSPDDSAPLALRSLRLEEPRPDEVVVEVAYAGVCQTDIKAMHGKQGTLKPAVLGHEGVGTVVAIGSAVRRVDPGDRVLMHFASCGHCTSCDAGSPSYCEEVRALNMNAEREDHTSAYVGTDVHSHFFGQSSFASHSMVAERNLVKLPPDLPFVVAAAMGCGVLTGSGAVLNILAPRAGTSLLVVGAGAVGLSAVMSAKASGCSVVVVVDLHDNRLEIARQVGATHTFSAARPDLVDAIVAATSGGADYAVEAVGHPKALETALASLGRMGACVVAGASPEPQGFFSWRRLLLGGHTIRGTANGDVNPATHFPKLAQLHREGRFPVEKMCKVYPFEKINDAIADAEKGKTIKPLLEMSGN
jgi:aryl-alcohol dehydrogenase